ncbi:hypothetical protein [Mucilaginibacter sp. HD30]
MKILLKNGMIHLALLLVFTFLLIRIAGEIVLTAEFYANSGDPLSGIPGQGAGVLELMQKWIYLTSAVYLLIKLGLITLILHTALYLNNQNVSLNSVFKITVVAEYIFLIPAAIKLGTFSYTHPDGNLLDWHQYYVLAAITLFKEVPAGWYYALQTLNAFEVIYWFLLAFGVMRISSLNYDAALRMIFVSYVPSLLLWVAVVTFVCLLMFPSMG